MKGVPTQSLSEWAKTVEDKKKPIMLYWSNCKPIVARANLHSFRVWLLTATVVKDPSRLKIHKVFDIPNDSYQVYVTE